MFDIPYLFLSGGPALSGGRNATETIAVYIYKMAFDTGGEMQYGIASAASVYLFVICMTISFVLFRVTHTDESKRQRRAERKIWGGVHHESGNAD